MTVDFEERAEQWDDDPRRVRRASAVAAMIRAVVPLGGDTRLVEFGAGTGLLAGHLAGDVGSVTLIDTSPAMRDQAQQKIDAGFFGQDAEVLALDLERDSIPTATCDVVTALMSLHHVGDVSATLAAFATMLGPGGVLAVVDLEFDADHSFHGDDFDGYHGFRRDELGSWTSEAGFREIEFRHAYTMDKQDRSYDLFLMTAATPQAPAR